MRFFSSNRGFTSNCKSQEIKQKTIVEAEEKIDKSVIKSVITNKQLFKTIIKAGRGTRNVFECFNYTSLTNAEWIIRNQYYGLLEYKLKRNDPLHFSLASIQMICNHLDGDMKLFNLIYEKKRSLFFSDTLLECAATSGNTKVFKILLDQTYPKQLDLYHQPRLLYYFQDGFTIKVGPCHEYPEEIHPFHPCHSLNKAINGCHIGIFELLVGGGGGGLVNVENNTTPSKILTNDSKRISSFLEFLYNFIETKLSTPNETIVSIAKKFVSPLFFPLLKSNNLSLIKKYYGNDDQIFDENDFSDWIRSLHNQTLEEIENDGVVETIEWILCENITKFPHNQGIIDCAHKISASLSSLNKQEKLYICFTYYFDKLSSWQDLRNDQFPLLGIYTKYYASVIQEKMSIEDDSSFIKSLGEETYTFINFIIKGIKKHESVYSFLYEDVALLRCAWIIYELIRPGYFCQRVPFKCLKALQYCQQRFRKTYEFNFTDFSEAIKRQDSCMIEYLFQINREDIIAKIIEDIDGFVSLMLELAYTEDFNEDVAKVLYENTKLIAKPPFSKKLDYRLFASLNAIIFYNTYLNPGLKDEKIDYSKDLPIIAYFFTNSQPPWDENIKHLMKKACKYGDLSMVQYLFENHFDALKLDGISCSFLDRAFNRGHMSIVNYLITEKNQYFGKNCCATTAVMCDNSLLEFVITNTHPSKAQKIKSSIIEEAIQYGVYHYVQHIHNHQVSLPRYLDFFTYTDQPSQLKYIIDNTKFNVNGEQEQDSNSSASLFITKLTRSECLNELVISSIQRCSLECFKLLVDHYHCPLNNDVTEELERDKDKSYPFLLLLKNK
ncbi:hypothetical protein DFA_09723 [Cavenderia fasciculata]|uniref:Ankyrin repeat-containing protein n=1 Tax=Cavenderia fasciculata TaxID=261658 RepID=F4Q8F1_CACFS|nr:uncharacterized protein DFA_09723 [Cavenderia fasciculata]EGG16051.1 hypothetical protein DFA_09723 [Cavenderia fasciculata]|eukprot:XP_004352376.1 hypothetical protein DFA_09723 [Cavenderia fasciculata]